MFDYHLHTEVSFDSEEQPQNMINAAERLGLKEICFTDHYDFNDVYKDRQDIFALDQYRLAYDDLKSDTVKIRRGVEFGITEWNMPQLKSLTNGYAFDFVLGSVHYAGGTDPYFQEFWNNITVPEAFQKYLLKTLECVKAHSDFDVLGHLNYVCKSQFNPLRKSFSYNDYSDICDEIMKVLVSKGKGMEINTSGVDRVGDFLPSIDFIKRFKELGGEIITVGSDAHDACRIGQYTNEAVEIAKDVFGYVCTFEKRNVIYHKL